MKNISIIIISLFYCNLNIAQSAEISIWNGSDYNPSVLFPTPSISSDYGPRDYTTQSGRLSRFHSGVDLIHNDGLGGLIGSIEAGIVKRLDGNEGLKVIVIQFAGKAYSYTHVFNENYPSNMNNCWLRNDAKDSDQDSYPCVLYKYDGEYYAIGIKNGTIDVHGDGTLIKNVSTVVNAVGTGHPCYIGAYGNSGTPNAHLHLGVLESGSIQTGNSTEWDPMHFVNHDQPDYNINIYATDPDPFKFIYPGTDASKIKVVPEMDNANGDPYYSSYYNLHDLLINVKKDYEQIIYYEPIRSHINTAEFSYGAKLGTNSKLFEKVDNMTFGSTTKTGVKPVAYKSRESDPYDEFYYNDFITRIHKDDVMDTEEPISSILIAYCPQNARYNDGIYDMRVSVKTVVDIIHDEYETDLILDNYKPFVESVTGIIGGFPFYQKNWVCQTSCITLEGEDLSTEIDYGSFVINGFYLQVLSSEPLSYLTLTIPNSNIINLAGIPQDESHLSWTFNISSSDLLGLTDVKLEFDGEDTNNNNLLALNSNYGCVTVPTRKDEFSGDDWENPDNILNGIDITHFFSLLCGPNLVQNGTEVILQHGDCFDNGGLDEVITHTSGHLASDGSIVLTPNLDMLVEPISYFWDDGGQGTRTNARYDLEVGTYCVRILDAYCCAYDMCYDIEERCPLLFYGVDNHGFIKCEGDKGTLTLLLTTDGEEPREFNWSNGETTRSIDNLDQGFYGVTVTDAFGCVQILDDIPMIDRSIPTTILGDINEVHFELSYIK